MSYPELAEKISSLYEKWSKVSSSDATSMKINVDAQTIEIPSDAQDILDGDVPPVPAGQKYMAHLTITDEGDFWAVRVDTSRQTEIKGSLLAIENSQAASLQYGLNIGKDGKIDLSSVFKAWSKGDVVETMELDESIAVKALNAIVDAANKGFSFH